MEKLKCDKAFAPPEVTNQPVETRASPVRTVSTATLGVGLAHLLHEFYNPIHSIQCGVWLFAQEMDEAERSGNPCPDEAFQHVKREVDRMVSLVTSVRSQLESLWQINPSVDPVNLGSLIEKILQREAMRFEAAGVRITKNMIADLPLIEGDKKLLEVAFLNLFKNAADAMPEGGVLAVSATSRESSVWIEISDTGEGTRPDVDIFQPFATSKPGGMGLGLAITRHVIETHGGTITYKCRPGTGMTFRINFPSKTEATPKSYEPVRSEELFGCLCHAPQDRSWSRGSYF
jgi:signal transduction histidine kinase